jgi:type IV pilus assembly protein PilN
MIKINLLPTRVKRKKKAPSRSLFYFIGILILEIAFFTVWWQKESQEYNDIANKNSLMNLKIQELTKVKQLSEEWESEKKLIEQQVTIFESLKYDKTGVPNMFLFLSYVLSKPEDIPANKDEIKALEMAGWDTKWDPRRVWIKKIEEKTKSVMIEGEAIDHEDVAEFYRRLETGAFFYGIEPGMQEKQLKSELSNLEFVSFKVNVSINYKVDIETSGEITGS